MSQDHTGAGLAASSGRSPLEATGIPDATSFEPTSVNVIASYGQLLDAPAYEDAALFDAVEMPPSGDGAGRSDAAAGGSRGGGGDSRPPPPTVVTVDDPVKKIEQSLIPGMSGGFVTYRVSTVTSLESFEKKQCAVRRRFRDFVALHELLKATHRGYIIPPRPEKNTVEGQRATEEFVEGRRAGLQRYMNQLAGHPVIGLCTELRTFLESEGPLSDSLDWQHLQPLQGSLLDGAVRLPKQLIGQDRSILTPTEATQSARASGDLLRRFKELRQAVRNDHVEAPRLGPGEAALRDETRQIEELQDRVVEASRKAERMVAKMEEAGAALGDFGLSLVKLSKFEDERGAPAAGLTRQAGATRMLAADCKRAGMASVRLSRLAKAANDQAITALEPLHTNLALCPAVLKALREREAQLLTVQAIEADIAKKHKALGILEEQGQRTFGNEAQRGRKQEAVQNDLAALEMALESARAELDKITSRNREELNRWADERRSDFSKMQDAFLRVQVMFHERNCSVWLATAEEFEAARAPGRAT